MKPRKTFVITVVLAAAPTSVWILWACSGREALTKARRAVEVEVVDDLFGDTVKETRMIPGPIAGYYVGLDLALTITGAALIVGGVSFWRTRRRVVPQANGGERSGT